MVFQETSEYQKYHVHICVHVYVWERKTQRQKCKHSQNLQPKDFSRTFKIDFFVFPWTNFNRNLLHSLCWFFSDLPLLFWSLSVSIQVWVFEDVWVVFEHGYTIFEHFHWSVLILQNSAYLVKELPWGPLQHSLLLSLMLPTA